MDMKEIAHIETDFSEKFGIPRQSGLIAETKAKIIFEPEYRTWDAFKGLEQYSHIWIIWKFSKAVRKNWSATVKPPRLGGNKRVGVFATRSPFRPNPIGLSSVKLESVQQDNVLGTVLYVSGADLMNGTPIYDIKPYLAYTDSHPEAVGGFADEVRAYKLSVNFPKELQAKLTPEFVTCVTKIIEQDPRPSYIEDEQRVYGVSYAGYNIKFKVVRTIATILEVEILGQ